ncbi:MAG: hypothetical protein KDA86_24870 [Planctomycetaceae bacterium]|nr:hypothetical protein [Planctomycetaceae bacterium]
MNSSSALDANRDASETNSTNNNADQLSDDTEGSAVPESTIPDGDADPAEDTDRTPAEEASSGNQPEQESEVETEDDPTASTEQSGETDDAIVPVTLESGGPVNLDQQLDVVYGDGLAATQSWMRSLWEETSVGPLLEGIESFLMALANRSREVVLTGAALLTGFLVILNDDQKLTAAKVIRRLRKQS